MSRDIVLEKQDIESMLPLSKTQGNSVGSSAPSEDQESFIHNHDATDKIQRDMSSKNTVLYELRPLQQILGLDDLESCIVLENAAFEHPEHRCTKEKVRHDRQSSK